MWTRADLKQKGKIAFKRNYWKCVLVALLLAIFVESGSYGSSTSTNSNNNTIDYNNEYWSDDNSWSDYWDDGDVDEDSDWEENIDEDDNGFSNLSYHTESNNITQTSFSNLISKLPDWIRNITYTPIRWMSFLKFGVFSLSGLTICISGLLLSIFVFSMLEIGGCRFFIQNSVSEDTSVGELLFAFQSGTYGKMVLTQFLRKLYKSLWTLLLIIPGIVKTYEYRMIPYLLADFPEMTKDEVFRVSKQMMNGNKMDTFILDLSFIGWVILNAITLGIVGIFYANPYIKATNAELYLTLKEQYFGTNTANQYYEY